jgi:hypothetical protein
MSEVCFPSALIDGAIVIGELPIAVAHAVQPAAGVGFLFGIVKPHLWPCGKPNKSGELWADCSITLGNIIDHLQYHQKIVKICKNHPQMIPNARFLIGTT